MEREGPTNKKRLKNLNGGETEWVSRRVGAAVVAVELVVVLALVWLTLGLQPEAAASYTALHYTHSSSARGLSHLPFWHRLAQTICPFLTKQTHLQTAAGWQRWNRLLGRRMSKLGRTNSQLSANKPAYECIYWRLHCLFVSCAPLFLAQRSSLSPPTSQRHRTAQSTKGNSFNHYSILKPHFDWNVITLRPLMNLLFGA